MHASFGQERQKILAKVLADTGSFATTMFLGTLGYYGPQIIEWDPETVLKELESDFAIRMPQECYDRLMAARVVATTDLFEHDLPTFIHICNVLSGSPITDEFDPASCLEMAWAITEMGFMDLAPGEDRQFSEDIRYYVAEMCKEEGIINPPVVLAKLTTGLSLDPTTDFSSDDPSFAQGIWYTQQTKVLDIQLVVQSNLWKLYQQLKEVLPGEHIHKKLTELQQSTSASIDSLRQQEAELAPG